MISPKAAADCFPVVASLRPGWPGPGLTVAKSNQ